MMLQSSFLKLGLKGLLTEQGKQAEALKAKAIADAINSHSPKSLIGY